MSAGTNGKTGVGVVNVSKTYNAGESQVKALRGAPMDVPQNDFLSIAGPSGSGRTTLFNLIGCFDTADAGEIATDGSRVSGMKRDELAMFRRR